MSKEHDKEAVTNGELKKQFRWQDAAIVLAILGSFATGYIHLVETARAEGDASVTPLTKRVDLVEQEQRHLKDDMHEIQVDIRSLYKAWKTGQEQERLEAPLDGGR